MKKLISIFGIICISACCITCTEKKVDFNYNNIVKIDIDNRAYFLFGGTKHIVITDKEEIIKICKMISSFSVESNQMLRPFIGDIEIIFTYSNSNNSMYIKSEYTTAIIFKENNSYLITNTNGYFIDDEFVEEIKSLLKIKKQ